MNSLFSDNSIIGNRFITFIDLMGFKNLVATESHEVIYNKMLVNYRNIIGNIKAKWFKTEIHIGHITFSDSMVLYTEDDTPESLRNLVCATSSLSYDLFVNQMPHKGALAKGLLTTDIQKSIFFGQPIIDAYELQTNLFYYGIIFQNGAFNYYNDIVIPSNMKIPFLFEYLCPMKDKLEKHLTIFPIYSKFPPKNDESNKENDNKHHEAFFDSLKELKNDENSKLNCYYNNTITYFENLNKV